MKKYKFQLLVSSAALVTASCAHDKYVSTTDGCRVPLPKCEAAISYQGTKWGVQGIDIDGAKVGGVEWEKTFRNVEPLIEVLDKQDVRNCQSLRVFVATSSLTEVRKELARREAVESKLRQLELIIAAKDPVALKRFVDVYYLPVADSFYEENRSNESPRVVVAKTDATNEAFKLKNIDARPTSEIIKPE